MQEAGPADDPVEYSSIFHGFLVLPPNQISSYAKEPVTNFATRTAPADFSLHQPYLDYYKYTHSKNGYLDLALYVIDFMISYTFYKPKLQYQELGL